MHRHTNLCQNCCQRVLIKPQFSENKAAPTTNIEEQLYSSRTIYNACTNPTLT